MNSFEEVWELKEKLGEDVQRIGTPLWRLEVMFKNECELFLRRAERILEVEDHYLDKIHEIFRN